MNFTKCKKDDCTIASTGICLELYNPSEECPNLIRTDTLSQQPISTVKVDSSAVNIQQPVSIKTENKIAFGETRQFYAGLELGVEDAIEVMRRQYVHFIGILGQTDVGKTAYLSALYLMATRGLLKPDYCFAGSLTLQGFEDRARGLRKWLYGKLPDKFMDHTQLQDPRNPSFMNLKLKELTGEKRLLELLLTDLPGEWSDDFINTIQASEKFNFLKRADGLIYVLDGTLLENPKTRHLQVHRARNTFSRLGNTSLFKPELPVILLISKCDETEEIPKESLQEIINKAKEMGFNPHIIEAACISRIPPKLPSGTGVLETINYIVKGGI